MRTVFRLLAAGALTGYKEHKRRGRPVYVSREQAADVAMRRFTRLHGRRTPPA
jgi:hypothetical protein